jgi:hypothetical protein
MYDHHGGSYTYALTLVAVIVSAKIALAAKKLWFST